MEEKTKIGDFVELKFTGYSDGKVFDSNIEKDLKQVAPDALPQKTIVIIGQAMVVPGLDKALENKLFGEEYSVDIPFKDGFGERHKEMVKTIPLKVFHEQKIDPRPGLTLMLDNNFAKVIAVSGARVITDFNSPLAGRNLNYKFIIVRKVEDIKEKSEAFFENFLRFKPEFDITDKITVRGPAIFEKIAEFYKDKFLQLVGRKLEFKLEEKKHQEPKQDKTEIPADKVI